MWQAVFAMSANSSAADNEHCRACMSVEELMKRARKLAGKASAKNDVQQSSTTHTSSVRVFLLQHAKKMK